MIPVMISSLARSFFLIECCAGVTCLPGRVEKFSFSESKILDRQTKFMPEFLVSDIIVLRAFIYKAFKHRRIFFSFDLIQIES